MNFFNKNQLDIFLSNNKFKQILKEFKQDLENEDYLEAIHKINSDVVHSIVIDYDKRKHYDKNQLLIIFIYKFFNSLQIVEKSYDYYDAALLMNECIHILTQISNIAHEIYNDDINFIRENIILNENLCFHRKLSFFMYLEYSSDILLSDIVILIFVRLLLQLCESHKEIFEIEMGT